MGKLNYCAYDLFKPIGETSEKHVTARVFTDGTVDIRGTIGLEDCVEVPWEHGTPEYLRSLDTGNARYEFKLSIPFNDFNSSLWWKLDEPEEIPESTDSTLYDQLQISTNQRKFRYYKKYEKERFLRWFGTDRVPELDLNQICKKTICSAPHLTNSINDGKFYEDSNNIMDNPDRTKVNIDNQTQLSLLSMCPRSTIDLIDKEDGQYLTFTVGGHQRTSTLSFHIQGKMRGQNRDNQQFGGTLEQMYKKALSLEKSIRFLDLTYEMNPNIMELWKTTMGGELEYVPRRWIEVLGIVENALDRRTEAQRADSQCAAPLQNPIDLLRFRAIDIESLFNWIEREVMERYKFIRGMSRRSYDNLDEVLSYSEQQARELDSQKLSNLEDYLDELVKQNKIDLQTKDRLVRYNQGIELWNWDLFIYIRDTSPSEVGSIESDTILSRVNLPLPIKEQLKHDIVNKWYALDPKVKYESTEDDIRESIVAFNSMLPRLPIVTRDNKVASRNIFLDWKNYVERTLKRLVEQGHLHERQINEWEYEDNPILRDILCKSTDGKWYSYTEYYIDEDMTVPLVDYSYRYKIDDCGSVEILKDRFDFWCPEDFME